MRPICIALLAVITALFINNSQSAFAQEDPIVAKVGSLELKKSDLENAYESLPAQYRQAPLEMVFEPLLDRLIDNELVLKAARDENIESEPEVQLALDQARDTVLREMLIARKIDEAASEDALKAAYDERSKEEGFSFEEVKARHILLEDEEAAKAVIEELAGGADFAETAQEKSVGPSASNGGDLGYFRHESMVPPFADAAFSMEPGSFSQEPVQTQFGWHVILVEDKKQTVPSFEETAPQLRQELAEAAVSEYLAGLREGQSIELFNIDGSPRQ